MGNVYQQQAELLVAMAHTICAYSKGTRGNVEVKMLAIGRRLLVAGRQVAIRHVGQWGRGAGGGREQVAEVVVDVAFLALHLRQQAELAVGNRRDIEEGRFPKNCRSPT